MALEAQAVIGWQDGMPVSAIQASLIDAALRQVSPDEPIWDAGQWIVPDRDALFSYAGLQLLSDRYLVRPRDGGVVELPQEVFLGIALTLAQAERPTDRLRWAQAFYAVLSRLDVTLATPTFANARRPHGQLSSCFVDTVPDSLEGIYHGLSTFARISKAGGGMGSYLGKIRATGSPIRGVAGVAKGVLPWARLYNDTAVAVDQLGQRRGAVTLWLDVWHPDVRDFLEARTPHGDANLGRAGAAVARSQGRAWRLPGVFRAPAAPGMGGIMGTRKSRRRTRRVTPRRMLRGIWGHLVPPSE